MQFIGLLVLFGAIMILQSLVLTEAFGTSPGTQIQMNANHPVYFVTAMPEYVQEPTQVPWWAPFRSYWLGLTTN